MPRPGVGNPGNKGGGRKGYEYEADQMKMMKKNINWFLFYIESVRTGKNTAESDKKFKMLEKTLLKMMDKVHPNRNTNEMSGELTTKADLTDEQLARIIKQRSEELDS